MGISETILSWIDMKTVVRRYLSDVCNVTRTSPPEHPHLDRRLDTRY
ncbi:hypothetical protein HMPREF1318_0153 [Actinomyces massiliensis F0489]|uniref:Uncharacterized protein n=1 Tax=Actinomyces massiliensis F0489 TaxID=1125718 RepID=J1HK95_9ACTO|nr:hypothetical protein HMPREF1318_0153 [Actinomyces massiliensis F0489]